MTRPDAAVVVVGAGPAGLAAAATAAAAGADVVLLDAGSSPGGQFWRQPAPGATSRVGTALDPARLTPLHHDLATYDALLAGLDAVDHRPLHHVWAVEREADDWAVHVVDRTGGGERAVSVRAPRLVLAPGAYDRQLPFPGWDLPGVMTAGGAQALLKGHGVRAGDRVVVAGTGPFLLPVATGLAAAGSQVVGVFEANRPTRWAAHARAVVDSPGKITEAAAYAAALLRARVPVRTGWAVVEAHGTEAVESVTVARIDGRGVPRPGTERRIDTDLVAVGWGFTPQLELPLQAGAPTRVDVDGSLVCVVDEDQATGVERLWVAGEACGVGGAAVSVIEGRIAGASAAGAAVDPRLARERERQRRFARAMHLAHPVPPDWPAWLTDATTLCRCEEVSVGDVRAVAAPDDAADFRTAKLLTRPGMGWCQGRVCGFATACLLAHGSGTDPDLRAGSLRPLATPLTLGTLIDATSDTLPRESPHRRGLSRPGTPPRP